MITWGAQLSTRGPHALTGGPSVQEEFPHLKISTLITAHRPTVPAGAAAARSKISSLQLPTNSPLNYIAYERPNRRGATYIGRT